MCPGRGTRRIPDFKKRPSWWITGSLLAWESVTVTPVNPFWAVTRYHGPILMFESLARFSERLVSGHCGSWWLESLESWKVNTAIFGKIWKAKRLIIKSWGSRKAVGRRWKWKPGGGRISLQGFLSRSPGCRTTGHAPPTWQVHGSWNCPQHQCQLKSSTASFPYIFSSSICILCAELVCLLQLKRLCAEAFLNADFSHPRAVSITLSSIWHNCDFAQG